ncbi:2-hydroxyacid dehydrogenase [Streptomyces sp. NPDC088124]|uniref:2-hydroxyacid dehydrogenase n=1 Tax=Streptomyces sp. NPDC088124 TaxID=3154654 RepID=UPI003423E990
MTPDVWLPIPAAEIEGLPEGPRYVQWDGEDEFPADPADCAFYVVPYMRPPETVVRPLAAMTSLRVVQTLSAGTDNVAPALGVLPAGVRLCNAKGVHEASTAELALTLTLASLRGIPGYVRGQDREEWRAGFRPALADRSVLIVGYGSIGAAIEDRLTPFECARVTRVARSARTTERGQVHAFTELPALLPEADVVILSTPLTEGTKGLVGAEFLARMKDGALLVNVARGAVVDTKALLAELESGRIEAALDVTDPEPLPAGHPLWHAPGVLISPHVGGPTSAFLPRAKRLLAGQLTRFAAGDELRNVVLTTEGPTGSTEGPKGSSAA